MSRPSYNSRPIRWTLVLWGASLFVTGFAGHGFFLHTYDGGGALEYRGRLPGWEKYFPEGVDYIFFNHGHVTPISEEFYEYVRDADVVDGNLAILGFAAMIAALIAYGIMIDGLDGDGSRMKLRMFLAVFLPRNDDPFITRAGKYFLLLTVASFNGLHRVTGTVFGFYPMPPSAGGVVSRVAETAFVEYVWRTHTTCAALAVLMALLHGWLATRSDQTPPRGHTRPHEA